MAEESQDGQEKTEEPSQRKIDKSREDGQVLQSKEMFVFSSIAMGLLIFLFIPEFAIPGMNEWGRLFQIESKEQLSSLPFIHLYQVFEIIVKIFKNHFGSSQARTQSIACSSNSPVLAPMTAWCS